MSHSRASFAVSAPRAAWSGPLARARRALGAGAGHARGWLSGPDGRSALASLALGAGLAAVAFGAAGGTELESTTSVELGLLLVAGAVAATAVALARPAPAYGGTALVLFVALAALTGVSVAWSVAPELTWFESNKTLAYLAVFAGAVGLARLSPAGWPVVLKGLLVGAGIVTAYALASRVFPGALSDNELYARIGEPFDYWNAVGVTAALAVPPALWLGARRSGHPPANALAYPLLGLFIVALFLSFSRSALLAAGIGAALWLALVPLRLRSLAVLGVSAAGAAPVVAWALSRDAFTRDGMPPAVRETVAFEFGLFLVLMVLLLAAAGLGVGFLAARRPPSALLRRRIGIAGAAAAAALALLGAGYLTFSDPGIGGRISQLTNADATTTGGPERLTQASSSRARYWGEAGDVFADHPMRGTGAGTFGVARLRHRDDVLVARHAHGYVAQTASDLGVLGLLASFALAGAWLVAAARTLRLGRGGRGLPFGPERVGVAALALAVLVFGIQSTLDWTWFVPGSAVMALVAAGFVAGRGPLDPQAGGLASLRRPPAARLAAAGLVALAALLAAWSAWQPARADRASDRALAALSRGDVAEAAREARHAYEIDPLSPKPLFVAAAVQRRAGREAEAAQTLERAVVEHAGEPEAWLRLATFQLEVLDRPDAALETLRGALYLDPRSRQAQTTFFEARERLRAKEAAPRT